MTHHGTIHRSSAFIRLEPRVPHRRFDQRAEHGDRLGRIADRQRLGDGRYLGQKSFIDALLNQDAAGVHTDLALVEERAEGDGLRSVVEVGVIGDDDLVVAAQFQDAALEGR